MDSGMWIALLSGVAVAAACGFRAFLPLFALGLAGRFHLITLRGGAEWLTGDLALTAFAVAAVVEIVADKVPVVDHALDTVATVLRPVAAWLGAFAMLSGWPTPWAQIAALVLGTLALGVHGARAGARVGSTATTLGMANPFLSLIDDAIALLLLAAVVFGVIALVVVLLALILWLRSRRRRAVPAGPRAPLTPAV